MSSESNRQLIFCQNCGNKGMMDEVARYELNETDSDGYGHEYLVDTLLYQLFHCPVCDSVVLMKSSHVNGIFYDESEYCYPNRIFNPYGVPDDIKNAFEAAIATKGIDTGVCLMALRRTLEKICKDQGAEGDNLYKMIEKLEKDGKISPTIMNVCNVIRELGNEGAHGDTKSIWFQDLDRIIGYVATIIDYIYTIPKLTQSDMEKYCKKS